METQVNLIMDASNSNQGRWRYGSFWNEMNTYMINQPVMPMRIGPYNSARLQPRYPNYCYIRGCGGFPMYAPPYPSFALPGPGYGYPLAPMRPQLVLYNPFALHGPIYPAVPLRIETYVAPVWPCTWDYGNSLSAKIMKQIEYYFCDDNLTTDHYLKSKMDTHGWVPIDLIASFPRVKALTDDISIVLEALQDSTTVEVKNEMARSRHAWQNWVNNVDPDHHTPQN